MSVIKTPQEIEVWYIIPAIRKELASALVKEQKVSQKDAAKMLGITEAAISQYLNSKRAKDICFDTDIKRTIKESAKKIAKNSELAMEEMQNLCEKIKKSGFLCKIHKANSAVPKNCCVCTK
ncbi:MAG: helix-turn-helix domain-containing protein [bacterium]|nr:helix-turn-helix domain-containing protein [bacterium]